MTDMRLWHYVHPDALKVGDRVKVAPRGKLKFRPDGDEWEKIPTGTISDISEDGAFVVFDPGSGSLGSDFRTADVASLAWFVLDKDDEPDEPDEPIKTTPPAGTTTGHEPDPEGVNHPRHYNLHPAGIECIDVIEPMAFNVGTAIKYLWRAGLKPGEATEKDLRKAVWYIEREIERMKDERDADV